MRTALTLAMLLWVTAGPVPADTVEGREALAQMRAAAAEGDVEAQYRLGYMFERGIGTPPHHTEALQWYLRAARQGHALAQFQVGQLYRKGQSVPRDYGAAQEWLQRAAAQGLSRAQYILGVMRRDGQGGERDYVQAHVWFELARESGHRFADRARDSLRSQMSAEQVRQARQLAREWTQRHRR